MYTIITKLIEEDPISILIATSYVTNRNAVIKNAITLTIKYSKSITQVDTNQNFVSLTTTKIIDVNINNFVLLPILRLKLKYKWYICWIGIINSSCKSIRQFGALILFLMIGQAVCMPIIFKILEETLINIITR